MAQNDWTFLNDGADSASIDRGTTNGIDRPNGGGNFVYGFNSLVNTEGSVGLHINQVDFSPMAKGCRLQVAMKRGVSGGDDGFAPFVFVGLGGTSVNDIGYLLGLADDSQSNILLRKGAVSAGLPNNPAGDPATNGTLLRSTETIDIDEWIHLRLDYIVNGTGDATLKVFKNTNLGVGGVTSPIWTAVVGMEEFIDDALGVNSGSAPLTSGRAGMAFHSSASTRRGFFDHFQCFRQL